MIKHQIKGKLQVKKVTEYALDKSNLWIANTSKYSERSILETILETAIHKSSLESTVNKLQIQAEGYGSIPSVDTIFRAINREYADLSLEEIEAKVSSNLQEIANLSVLGIRKKRVNLALDIHNEEFYGKSMNDMQNSGKEFIVYNQTGRRRVFQYATLTVVSSGKNYSKPITIGFVIVYKGLKRIEIVEKLLKQIKGLNLQIDWLLMDGGFSGVDCIKYLQENHIKFVTRGKYSKKKAYLDSIGLSFAYEVKNASSSVKVEGMLLREKTKKGKRKLIFFLCSNIMTHAKLKQLYRQRFRIENTYRHQRVVKIRSSSRKLHIRWFLWAISILLELIWEIIASIYEIMGLDKYSSRQELINSHIVDYIQENLAPAKFRIH